MNNRRTNKTPAWAGWLGDMSIITEFLLTKPWLSPWCIPKTANSILRAIGTVAFANNPITGIFVLAAMFVGNANVGWACLHGGVIGVVFSKILRQPERLINDGVTVFNGILVGCIAVAVFPDIAGHRIDGIFWAYLTVAVILTAYVDKGLTAVMAPSKLPAFSIPFNISAAILLLIMRSAAGLEGRQVSLSLPEGEEVLSAAVNVTQEVEWSKVMEGTLLAAGQIYGVGTVDSSILIYLGFFCYSPILTFFFYVGSLIGTFIGVLASTAPYTEVYLGLWGYNALLTSGGLFFFLEPTPDVTLAAIVGPIMAAAVQAASTHIFAPTTVPVFSYPFNVATVLLLAISTVPDSPFTWIENRTYPEKHLFQYYRSLNSRQAVANGNPESSEPLRITTK